MNTTPRNSFVNKKTRDDTFLFVKFHNINYFQKKKQEEDAPLLTQKKESSSIART